MSNTKFDVLVVEDKDLIARQLAIYVSGNRWLNHAGTAGSEQQAIEMARRLRPDLVLLDFGLSTPAGGFDVWRALRELDPVPDVIAVTAAGDMATVDKAQRCGAFRYVVKPYTRATIEAKLTDYTSFRRSAMTAPSKPSQSDIDKRFSQRLRSCTPPRGLVLETLESIVGILRAAPEPVRASRVAELARVERGTANRYLIYLCGQGIAERVIDHGPPGHPAYLYTLAAGWKIQPE
jgi:response regulator of citrate/malate metabolism